MVVSKLVCCNKDHSVELIINRIVQFDPTRTLTIRNQFVNEMTRRFNKLKREIVDKIVKDNFLTPGEVTGSMFDSGLNIFFNAPQKFEYTNTSAKVSAFMRWLEGIEQEIVLQQGVSPGNISQQTPWTSKYISQSYQKGILRAKLELNKVGISPVLSSIGVLNPVHVDRSKLLFTRTFEDLKGITRMMDAHISRTLAEGMLEGSSPKVIAKRLTEKVDKIGRHRARILARTEMIRAHHIANVEEYKLAGIKGVVVKAEWVTAGFRVCPICQANEGHVFSLDEIRGLIPAHPQCRCVIVPVVQEPRRRR